VPFLTPLVAASEGFQAGDVYALGLLFGGVALFTAVAALSQQHERAFTAAVVYLVLGALLAGALGLLGVELLDPFEDAHVIERLAEFAVIVALFAAGLKLDRPLGWPGWRTPTLLLAVVMPVTITAVAALGAGLLGLSLGAAIVLGAALAPTDPVLAGEIQVGPPGEEDESEARFAITAEAGLNDGLAFPFVFLGVFVAQEEGAGWLMEWLLADVLYAVCLGLALGAVAGRLLAALVRVLHTRGYLLPSFDGWLAIATVLAVYGLTELVGAYGFLAAFASGLTFRRSEELSEEHHERVHRGAETVEKITELALVLLLGSTVTVAGLTEPGISGWVLAGALLFVVRPLITYVTLGAAGIPRAERVFIGWFGIRGIGSFYYVAVAIASGALATQEAQLVYWTVIICAGLSIVLHGVTSTPIVRRLGL
jgi:sodium/hydrogen antiporter